MYTKLCAVIQERVINLTVPHCLMTDYSNEVPITSTTTTRLH